MTPIQLWESEEFVTARQKGMEALLTYLEAMQAEYEAVSEMRRIFANQVLQRLKSGQEPDVFADILPLEALRNISPPDV